MFILSTNHFNDLQYVYLTIMKFKTFPYLKTINHGYEICVDKSWYQEHIHIINKIYTHSKWILTYTIPEKNIYFYENYIFITMLL